ncbi:MAG: ABC transporter permease [Chloroflexota bacterium]
MSTYLARQVIQLAIAVWGISVIVFVVNFVIGDPINALVPPETPEETRQLLRHQYGFDRPILVQYLDFARGAVVGNFGESYLFRKPALDLVLERLPATLQLTVAGMGVATLIAIPVGIISAYWRYSLIDNIATLVAVAGQAMPIYWLGLMLILLFSVHLRWLPASGYGTPQHLILPAFCLGVFTAPVAMRLVRSGMLDVLAQDYIRTARAKGLTEWAVVMRHALRNTMIPVVTVLGLQFGQLMGGAVITETVFAWPGVALLLINAIYRSDIPVMQAAVIILALIIAGVNFLVDLVVAVLDPRIRLK